MQTELLSMSLLNNGIQNEQKHTKKIKIDNKEHNNRQNVNICIINLDTNQEGQNVNEHF
jgi:hypothetical protein